MVGLEDSTHPTKLTEHDGKACNFDSPRAWVWLPPAASALACPRRASPASACRGLEGLGAARRARVSPAAGRPRWAALAGFATVTAVAAAGLSFPDHFAAAAPAGLAVRAAASAARP